MRRYLDENVLRRAAEILAHPPSSCLVLSNQSCPWEATKYLFNPIFYRSVSQQESSTRIVFAWKNSSLFALQHTKKRTTFRLKDGASFLISLASQWSLRVASRWNYLFRAALPLSLARFRFSQSRKERRTVSCILGPIVHSKRSEFATGIATISQNLPLKTYDENLYENKNAASNWPSNLCFSIR